MKGFVSREHFKMNVVSSRLELRFKIDPSLHGKGSSPIYAWSPCGALLASSGSSRVVHLHDAGGQLVDQVVPPSPSLVTVLSWSGDGEVLACCQYLSPIVVLYHTGLRETREVDTGSKDLTFLQWAPSGDVLCIGTGRGSLLLYDKETLQKKEAPAKLKKKLTCGDWSGNGVCIHASECKMLTICDASGKTLDQVKVKGRPLGVSFGTGGSVVAVNLESKTLLLYDIVQRDALELAFQDRYGKIVSYRWFGDGFIMVGFSNGFVVVISTKVEKVGREQFCSRFHVEGLRDCALCPEAKFVATLGDRSVKLIDMHDWREAHTYLILKEGGSDILDSLAWSSSGRLLSVSSKSGCLYIFERNIDIGPGSGSLSPKKAAFSSILRPIEVPVFFLLVLVSLVLFVAVATWYFDATVLELSRVLSFLSI